MIDIVTVKQMQEFDQMTIKTKTPSIELMNLAAKSIYEECDFSNKKIGIICGSGNNGGDGLALANILIEKGFSPYVYLISKKISNDSQFYLDKLNEKKYENIFDISKCNYDFGIIVDCILGTGFKGEVKENIKDVIVRILKQPTCISAKENGNVISIEIEKELGLEIIGDTKVSISSVEEEEEN